MGKFPDTYQTPSQTTAAQPFNSYHENPTLFLFRDPMLADRELPQEKAAICSANLGSQPQGAISPKTCPPICPTSP
jgi:hypothetical protein